MLQDAVVAVVTEEGIEIEEEEVVVVVAAVIEDQAVVETDNVMAIDPIEEVIETKSK